MAKNREDVYDLLLVRVATRTLQKLAIKSGNCESMHRSQEELLLSSYVVNFKQQHVL